MKKLFKYSLILSLSILMACSDQFIDPQPKVDLLVENYYQTEAHFFDALIAAYDPLHWTFVNGVWTSNVMLAEIRSDNARAGGDPSNSDQPGWQAIDDFENTTLTIESEAFWKRGWWGIYRTNLIINNDNLDTEQVRLYKAEAKFLRAWYHFDLFRVYGPIPKFDRVLNEADFLEVERETITDLFEFIKQDLRDAIELLPEQKYTGVFAGRVSKTTAQAVMGKVLLYQADFLNNNALFSEAATFLNEVISSGQYRLLDNYSDLFAYGVKNSDESVFEIQHTNLVPHSWNDGEFIDGNMMTQLSGIRGLCADHPLYEAGWGFTLPTQSLYEHFQADDTIRRNTSIISVEQFQDQGCNIDLTQQNMEDFMGYFQIKFANYRAYDNPNGGDPVLQKDPNQPVIRYADVLLMYAEAVFRGNGNEGEARQFINQVRERAAGPEAQSYRTVEQLMSDNGWTLQDAIWYERRSEFAIEGDRWFDLVRSGRATPEIFSSDDYRRNNINMDQLFLPIPQRDIDNTGGALSAYPEPDLFN